MVLFAETNGTTIPSIEPNDQHFSNQWGLKNGTTGKDIHATEAWDIYTGSSSNIIAIVDGGIDGTHSDLNGKVSGDTGYGWDGHGIHVAGIASAKTNNTTGVAGVDWNAQLHTQRVDNTDDTGTYQAVVDAVNYNSNVHVLNNSWSLTPAGRYSTTVRSAFAYAYKMNRVAAVAMGNNNGSQTQYPAGFGQGIIAVGATDENDGHPTFSNTGNHIDVAAPGVSILSTYRNGVSFSDPDYEYLSGTSMASPHVAGIASLLKGYNSNLYNDDIENIIRLGVDDKGPTGWDSEYGTGRVNARKALDFLRTPYSLTQLTATNGTINSTSGTFLMTFYSTPSLADGTYNVKRYVIRKAVTFPSAYCPVPYVWGRGVASAGYNYANPNFGMGFSQPVSGTITGSGATLETVVYEVWNLGGQYLGFKPTSPSGAVFAYTVLGISQPVGVTITGPTELMWKQSGTWTANHIRWKLFLHL